MPTETLSVDQARRIALAAQGFAKPKSAQTSNWRRIGQAVDTMGLLQIDSVNVLIRSHYMPVFSRIGPYDRASLDRRAWKRRDRALFEYWAHEASLLPLNLHPLLRWRMARAARLQGIYGGLAKFARERKDYVAAVLDEVRDRGPVSARDLSEPGERTGPWWGWCARRARSGRAPRPGRGPAPRTARRRHTPSARGRTSPARHRCPSAGRHSPCASGTADAIPAAAERPHAPSTRTAPGRASSRRGGPTTRGRRGRSARRPACSASGSARSPNRSAAGPWCRRPGRCAASSTSRRISAARIPGPQGRCGGPGRRSASRSASGNQSSGGGSGAMCRRRTPAAKSLCDARVRICQQAGVWLRPPFHGWTEQPGTV